MTLPASRHPITLTAVAAIGAASAATVTAADRFERSPGTTGTYAAGDFHNHTTCSDGSISLQKLIRKSTEEGDGNWGLDWFVQAGHGGSGNRNCTLVEDDSLSTPAYPHVADIGPQTTWANSIGAAGVKGNVGGTATPLSTQANPRMWRWQSVQEFSYPVAEYLSALKGVPVFMGVESVVAGHEHTSMSVVTGQLPDAAFKATLPATGPYAPIGNATALAKWTYCFDRGDTDTSRGGGQNWDCSVPGSANAADANWDAVAAKLTKNTGVEGHQKTVEAVKWMAAFHPDGSYYVPAHLERAGPFNPNGANGFNIEHLRDFNNAAPDVAFGFETQPGHGASDNRGEYRPRRNNFGNGVVVDSVGGTTYGGTGVYGAQVGGVWDALLGEGRNFWFFASSDWHNRGIFGPDDRRTTQDFHPGEYQRNYTFVGAEDDDRSRWGDHRAPNWVGRWHRARWARHHTPDRERESSRLTPQEIVDGLRSGNNFATSGQLIDRLAFVVCVDRSARAVEAMALEAARANTAPSDRHCATMGEKLIVRRGDKVVVGIAVRDPAGPNHSPYTFDNPSLKQIGMRQPLDHPELDHIDVIRGLVTGYRDAKDAVNYAGEWPRDWLQPDGSTLPLTAVPPAARNTSAEVIKTFADTRGRSGWTRAGRDYLTMSFRLPAVRDSQYVRLRGTNLPAAVPFETDNDGNPLPDLHTNAGEPSKLMIPCTAVGTTDFDGCPAHLEPAAAPSPISGQKAVSFDVAAWADLWFYSNPVFIEVKGSTMVAGVE